MKEKDPLADNPAPTIAILGHNDTVFQVIADLIEEKNNEGKNNHDVNSMDNTFHFITDNNQEVHKTSSPARSSPFTLLVFDTNDPAAVELIQHNLDELSRQNKMAKHFLILGVDYGYGRQWTQVEAKTLTSRYPNTSYTEYSPRDIESIQKLRQTINQTVTAEAKQWYEWGHAYLTRYRNDPSKKEAAEKALSCFFMALRDTPQLANEPFLTLFAELSNQKLPLEEAMVAFKKTYPHHKKITLSIPLEQAGTIQNNQEFETLLLKKAAQKLTGYAHPPLFKQLNRKRHVNDIDSLVADIKQQKIDNMDTLIHRLEKIPNKKRSLMRCINEIRVMTGEEPLPSPTKKPT